MAITWQSTSTNNSNSALANVRGANSDIRKSTNMFSKSVMEFGDFREEQANFIREGLAADASVALEGLNQMEQQAKIADQVRTSKDDRLKKMMLDGGQKYIKSVQSNRNLKATADINENNANFGSKTLKTKILKTNASNTASTIDSNNRATESRVLSDLYKSKKGKKSVEDITRDGLIHKQNVAKNELEKDEIVYRQNEIKNQAQKESVAAMMATEKAKIATENADTEVKSIIAQASYNATNNNRGDVQSAVSNKIKDGSNKAYISAQESESGVTAIRNNPNSLKTTSDFTLKAGAASSEVKADTETTKLAQIQARNTVDDNSALTQLRSLVISENPNTIVNFNTVRDKIKTIMPNASNKKIAQVLNHMKEAHKSRFSKNSKSTSKARKALTHKELKTNRLLELDNLLNNKYSEQWKKVLKSSDVNSDEFRDFVKSSQINKTDLVELYKRDKDINKAHEKSSFYTAIKDVEFDKLMEQTSGYAGFGADDKAAFSVLKNSKLIRKVDKSVVAGFLESIRHKGGGAVGWTDRSSDGLMTAFEEYVNKHKGKGKSNSGENQSAIQRAANKRAASGRPSR